MGFDAEDHDQSEISLVQSGNEEVRPVLNASGHVHEPDHNFSLLSVCSVGITTGSSWVAIGGSIVGTFAIRLT